MGGDGPRRTRRLVVGFGIAATGCRAAITAAGLDGRVKPRLPGPTLVAAQCAGSARRRAGADVVLALAAELATGLPARPRPHRAAAGRPIVATAIGVAVRVGGDILTALRPTPSGRSCRCCLSALAAVWQVSAGSGAGLSDAAYRLGTAALQRERMRRDLAAQMAGTRTTARCWRCFRGRPPSGQRAGRLPVAWLFTTPARSVGARRRRHAGNRRHLVGAPTRHVRRAPAVTALIAAALLAAAFALLQPGAGSRHRLTLEHTPQPTAGAAAIEPRRLRRASGWHSASSCSSAAPSA